MLVEDLMTIAPEPIWIEITEADRAAVQQQLEGDRYSNEQAEYRGYINALTLQIVQNYLTEDDSAELSPSDSLECDIPPHERASLWDMLDGVPLQIGETRIVLIPTVVLDQSGVEELSVPHEWVDHPTWAADYYVAIALHESEEWLQITGYATHHQIKTQAVFDPIDRTYWLDATQLIPDLAVLWVGRAVIPNPKPQVSPVPSIDQATADQLIDQLSQQILYSPRLDVPFSQWSSLIVNPEWRMALHQHRLAQPVKTAVSNQPVTVPATVVPSNAVTHLRQEIQKSGDAIWRDLTTLSDYLRSLVEPELRGEWAGAKGEGNGIKKTIPITLQGHGLNLVVAIQPTRESSELSVSVHVTAQQDKTALPEGLSMSVIDDTKTPVLRDVVSEKIERLGFSPFLADKGDRCWIELSLSDSSEITDLGVLLQ